MYTIKCEQQNPHDFCEYVTCSESEMLCKPDILMEVSFYLPNIATKHAD